MDLVRTTDRLSRRRLRGDAGEAQGRRSSTPFSRQRQKLWYRRIRTCLATIAAQAGKVRWRIVGRLNANIVSDVRQMHRASEYALEIEPTRIGFLFTNNFDDLAPTLLNAGRTLQWMGA